MKPPHAICGFGAHHHSRITLLIATLLLTLAIFSVRRGAGPTTTIAKPTTAPVLISERR